MKVWTVEVWLMIKDDAPWENWANEEVIADNITDACKKALEKQTEQYKPFAIEARSAKLNMEVTVE